jgi:hypothetical protein
VPPPLASVPEQLTNTTTEVGGEPLASVLGASAGVQVEACIAPAERWCTSRIQPRSSASSSPAHEPAGFAPQEFASALGQTWPPRAVVLINDGSPNGDGFERGIAPFRTQITYIWQPNGGPGGARNAGLRLARGAFVAFLGADDY